MSVVIPGLVDSDLIPPNKRLDRSLMLSPAHVAAVIAQIINAPPESLPTGDRASARYTTPSARAASVMSSNLSAVRAADVDRGARYVASAIGSQEGHQSGHLLGGAEAPERHCLGPLGGEFLDRFARRKAIADVLKLRGQHESDVYRIDQDSLWRQLLRQRLVERETRRAMSGGREQAAAQRLVRLSR